MVFEKNVNFYAFPFEFINISSGKLKSHAEFRSYLRVISETKWTICFLKKKKRKWMRILLIFNVILNSNLPEKICITFILCDVNHDKNPLLCCQNIVCPFDLSKEREKFLRREKKLDRNLCPNETRPNSPNLLGRNHPSEFLHLFHRQYTVKTKTNSNECLHFSR